MSVRAFAVFCLSTLLFSMCILSASASDDSWVCAYPGYLDSKPVIVHFTIEGGDLVEIGSPFDMHYKILQNNELAVVAAWSISVVELNQKKPEPSIGAMVVIINKQDGSFRRGNVLMSGDTTPSDGTCTH